MRIDDVRMQALVVPLAFLRSVFGLQIDIAAQKPKGCATLINGTPYPWKLTYSHSYQMDEWKFPPYIAPGNVHQQCIQFKKNKDDSGEAVYTFQDSPSPMSFTIQARRDKDYGKKRIEIQYHDDLRSLGNPKNSLIHLGFTHNGAVPFILVGDGKGNSGFDVSSNPPVAWMQATFEDISGQTLREFAMPASHDSGMFKITRHYWGIFHNTGTQTKTIYEQLVLGARHLDIRPIQRRGKFWTGHFSRVGKSRKVVGGLGASFEEIINDINRFNKEYPGELIIIDITHSMNRDNGWEDFGDREYQHLYEEMSHIDNLYEPSQKTLSKDVTTAYVSDLISKGGESTVLIRLPRWAPAPVVNRGPEVMRADHAFLILNADNQTELAGSSICEDTLCISGFQVIHDEESGVCACEGNPGSEVDPIRFHDEAQQEDDVIDIDEEAYFDVVRNQDTEFILQTNLVFDTVEDRSIPPKGVPVTRPGAFMSEDRLPASGAFSDTYSTKRLFTDQLQKMHSSRHWPRNDLMLRTTWTLTQPFSKVIDIGNKGSSIVAMAKQAHKVMYEKLWPEMTKRTYGNLIEVDNIVDSHLTAFTMGINRAFANPWDGGRIRVKRDIKMAVDVTGKGDIVIGSDGREEEEVFVPEWSGVEIDWLWFDIQNAKNWVAMRWCWLTKGKRKGKCYRQEEKYDLHRIIVQSHQEKWRMDKLMRDEKRRNAERVRKEKERKEKQIADREKELGGGG